MKRGSEREFTHSRRCSMSVCGLCRCACHTSCRWRQFFSFCQCRTCITFSCGCLGFPAVDPPPWWRQKVGGGSAVFAILVALPTSSPVPRETAAVWMFCPGSRRGPLPSTVQTSWRLRHQQGCRREPLATDMFFSYSCRCQQPAKEKRNKYNFPLLMNNQNIMQ